MSLSEDMWESGGPREGESDRQICLWSGRRMSETEEVEAKGERNRGRISEPGNLGEVWGEVVMV